MAILFLIRHGDTDWNRDEIFRGRADIELNETGIRQAELLSGYLAEAPLEAIYSSPLARALRTAAIIARPHRLEVIPANELVDFDYGKWQGLSHEAVKFRYKALYERWLKAPHRVRMPGGESLREVRERAFGLVMELKARHRGTIAIVSHRVVLKVVICALLGLSNAHFWNIRLDTCGITTFSYADRGFVLERHNDTSFLKPIRQLAAVDF